jgi:hypothetical protein
MEAIAAESAKEPSVVGTEVVVAEVVYVDSMAA